MAAYVENGVEKKFCASPQSIFWALLGEDTKLWFAYYEQNHWTI